VFCLIPPSSIPGAILLTGYLGGATATHRRVGDPYFLPHVLGAMVWGGLWLRDPRLQALLPVTKKQGVFRTCERRDGIPGDHERGKAFRELTYNGGMRFSLAFLLPLAALAQPGQSPAPSVVPPQLRQAASLINDFGNTRRYAAENAAVKPPAAGEQRVVLMGDSITDNLHNTQRFGPFFSGKPYLNRGIGGQVTGQMLLRFYPDVIALQPKAVIIFGGTNDIGGNIGPVAMETIENDLAAMADMARANGIKVIMASVTPVCDMPGKPPMTPGRPPESIRTLNQWIREFAASHKLGFLDYYSATVDAQGFLRAELTQDGLHPTAKGYEIMNPLAEKAIAEALR
jgi:lysophospholipase L1-like esterase